MVIVCLPQECCDDFKAVLCRNSKWPFANEYKHYLTFSTYRAKPDTDTFDDFARGKRTLRIWGCGD